MTDKQVNEFEIAAKIKTDLQGVPKETVAKILRWIAEAFDVHSVTDVTSSRSHDAPSILTHGASPTDPPRPGTDIKTFVNEKKPKSDQQFTAVVAYYYQFVAPERDRLNTINAQIMQNAARGVWTQKPKWGVTLNNAKTSGYLDSAGTGEFKLNAIGENLVAMTLPGDSGKSGTRRPRKAKTKKKAAKKTAKKKPIRHKR